MLSDLLYLSLTLMVVQERVMVGKRAQFSGRESWEVDPWPLLGQLYSLESRVAMGVWTSVGLGEKLKETCSFWKTWGRP